jgi:hypothetical protein
VRLALTATRNQRIGLGVLCRREWEWIFVILGLVAFSYAVNLVQWVAIPQKRLVYYCYYPPAIFLGVAILAS